MERRLNVVKLNLFLSSLYSMVATPNFPLCKFEFVCLIITGDQILGFDESSYIFVVELHKCWT